MNLDVELVKAIWIGLIEYLTVLLIGMVLYRYSVLYKIKENKQIKKQAFTDPLTGKGNRHKFLSDMDDHLIKKEKFAVCFMDLDGFKHVNDTLGHDAGDLLLIELSNMLEKNLPVTSISYRLGGDEFAIIMDKVNTIEEISKILDVLKEGLKEPVIINNTKIVLEYSLGISIYPTDGITRNELMAYADDAMYHIKENGKNSYYFHNDALKAQLNNKKKMEIDLKSALKNGEFDIEFQPRINLNNLNEICLETLIFWNHPVLGKLNSEYFIKQAEEMGIVIYLDEYVLKKSCERLDNLNLNGFKNVKMSINLSNTHAKRHEFGDRLYDILNEYKLNRGHIQIEFTNKINVKFLESYKYLIDKLKEAGVSICISNLELRYESLKLFKELKIDEIKINRGYISNKSNFNKNVLMDIINICKDLDYLTTVICIENEDELKYALNGLADKIQGNYLFKKVDSSSLEEFLTNYPSLQINIENMIKKLQYKG
ncbi:MAG: EAL domain-containing protein [Clostridia bacterium]|nr:EAL domain-containing protein [Clostridia bacterium]MDD4386770.1 EAL domain-containing protein [Clostridia bacterium]